MRLNEGIRGAWFENEISWVVGKRFRLKSFQKGGQHKEESLNVVPVVVPMHGDANASCTVHHMNVLTGHSFLQFRCTRMHKCEDA